MANSVQQYEPEEGDDVVLYINKFAPENFEEAKAILTDGFGAAMTDSGQSRYSFWLANPETCDIVGISFFKKGHTVEDWHAGEHRAKVMKQLEPLYRAPQIIQEYKFICEHRAN